MSTPRGEVGVEDTSSPLLEVGLSESSEPASVLFDVFNGRLVDLIPRWLRTCACAVLFRATPLLAGPDGPCSGALLGGPAKEVVPGGFTSGVEERMAEVEGGAKVEGGARGEDDDGG